VVLLDEIEKAHPEVFNVLLQVLDDGRLTDSKGRTVNFKNTIIIMTSNLGSQLISERVAADFGATRRWEDAFAELRNELLQLLRQNIRPEFLNRVDEVIIFRPLAAADIRAIVDLQVSRVAALLASKGFTLEVTDEAREWLGKLGYDPSFGARPLKRVIQKHIVNPLSEKVIAGEFTPGDTVEVRLDTRGLITLGRKTEARVIR